MVAVLALAALAAGSDEPAAPTPVAPTAQDQFEALVKEIGSLRSDLEKLDRQERSLVNEMDRLEVESSLNAREMERLGLMKQRAGADLERTTRQLGARKGEVARSEADLAAHLRAAYEVGRSRELRLVLALTEPVDVMRAIAYLDVMARRQSAAVGRLREGKVEMEALERSLQVQTAGLEELERQQRGRAGDLKTVRERSRQLLESTRQERDAHRSAIGELTRAAEELESAIVSSGTADIPTVDVGKLRGALEWPVPGEIATGFGDIRNAKFGTVTPHPGIDIRTTPGEPVRAILPGRVAFTRRFSGYGNTVLLDHGAGCLSVYARLAVVAVSDGAQVLAGQTLGESAQTAFDGGPPTVYFELRRDGRAVDPAGWLKKKAASRREEGR